MKINKLININQMIANNLINPQTTNNNKVN